MTGFTETPKNTLTYLLSLKMVNAHEWLLVPKRYVRIKISGNILFPTRG
jgi:hypothetical protein